MVVFLRFLNHHIRWWNHDTSKQALHHAGTHVSVMTQSLEMLSSLLCVSTSVALDWASMRSQRPPSGDVRVSACNAELQGCDCRGGIAYQSPGVEDFPALRQAQY